MFATIYLCQKLSSPFFSIRRQSFQWDFSWKSKLPDGIFYWQLWLPVCTKKNGKIFIYGGWGDGNAKSSNRKSVNKLICQLNRDYLDSDLTFLNIILTTYEMRHLKAISHLGYNLRFKNYFIHSFQPFLIHCSFFFR